MELAHLARKHPRWHFTAVEPAGKMLDICRRRAETEGFASRCHLHEGYLETLPEMDPHHAATSFLVSQFILDPTARETFFQSIAERLLPGGILASSDLAADLDSEAFERLLPLWTRLLSGAPASPEALERTRNVYTRDVAVLPPAQVASIIRSGGFEPVVPFYQAGLLHAWFARRA